MQMANTRKKKLLILGGGFGGIYAAMRLDRTIARDDDVEVTLVNRENFFLFTPMLHEVAASDLDLTNIVSPIRKLLKRVSFFQGEVEQIDLESRRVTLVHGSDSHRHVVRYDYLLLALGSVTSFYGLPGVEQRALTMKTLDDAIRLRNSAIARMEEADTECAAAVREPLMSFVIVGGGFAGVETAGGLNDFVRESLRFYPNLSPGDVRVVLIHAGEEILPELGPELGAYARKKLTHEGIDIETRARVASVSDDGVELADGRLIPTRTVIWTAGTTPHPLVATLPCASARGRVKVNEFLEAEGFENVWAIGDCAAVPDHRTGTPCPPTAQHALRQGTAAARNIEAAIRAARTDMSHADRPRRPFRFNSPGALAAIGRRAGVAKIFGVKFSGFVAWFLWRTIYLSKLPRFEKKLRVALDWTLDLFFSKDLVQYLSTPAAARTRELPQPLEHEAAA